jgi:hypothetical protein
MSVIHDTMPMPPPSVNRVPLIASGVAALGSVLPWVTVTTGFGAI